MSGREFDWFLDNGPYPKEKKMTARPEPAFPHQELCGDGTHFTTHEGMSLRDYFAAKVLMGKYASGSAYTRPERTAMDCYLMADAMMAEREKR